ncbi:MAG: site-specific integrase [Colwellia sp.]|nr:site-specific integrase [Colwellia sp.]
MANDGVFETPRKMFFEFSNRLHTGTIVNWSDPSQLYWKPRTPVYARTLIGYIAHYTDWLSDVNEDSSLQLDPYERADKLQERLNWAAYYQKRERAFLSHLWKTDEAKISNSRSRLSAKSLKSLSVESGSCSFDLHTPFPEKHIGRLLTEGFARPGRVIASKAAVDTNIRDVLITLLMHYGGLRVSEVFHLYTYDFQGFSENDFVVKVYHPEYGISPVEGFESRREYLASYGLIPRFEYPKTKKRHAGWKGSLLTSNREKSFIINFFPQSVQAKVFQLWKIYIASSRVRPAKGEAHPYAFTSRDGSPLSIDSFVASHKRAVKSIGLRYGQMHCTTPHCHRHSFGQRLAKSGLEPIFIKTAMHHKSIESQQVYTQPSYETFNNRMREADAELTEKFQASSKVPTLYEEE